MRIVVLNRTTCDRKNSSSSLKQHYVRLTQRRNPVHHHIMLISMSRTLIRRKKIHPYCTNTLHTPIHQDHSTENNSARGPGLILMVVLDQHHTLREETHSEGRNTAIRTVDSTGRKKTTLFLWDSKVLDFHLWKKTGGIKMGDSDRDGQDKLFKRLPAPLDFPFRCAIGHIVIKCPCRDSLEDKLPLLMGHVE